MRILLSTVLVMTLGIPTVTAGPADHKQVGSVRIELRINKTAYDVGEPVEITIAVTNQGMETASFQFPTGQMFDLVALHEGQRIWQWSERRAFTQAFTTLSVQAGESKVFHERWNQQDAHDRQVPPGDYELVAVFPAQGGRLPSPLEGPRVRFRIGAGTHLTAPSVGSRAVSIGEREVGEVLINGRPVLRIRVAAGGLAAPDRAALVAMRLRQLLDAGLTPRELTVSRVGPDAAIMWRNKLVITADAGHARLNNTTPYALALQWRRSLVRALSL